MITSRITHKSYNPESCVYISNMLQAKKYLETLGGDILVDDLLSVHQFNDRHTQFGGQWLQQADIRQTLAGFPLGDGFAADAELFRQLGLGHFALLPQLLDGISCYVRIHGITPFLASSIAWHWIRRNLCFVDNRKQT